MRSRTTTRMKTLRRLLAGSSLCALLAVTAQAGEGAGAKLADALATVDRRIEASLDEWQAFYKTCHANPELSRHEKESADRLAKIFKAAGIEVTQNIGGHGVVGVLRNGDGPTVLIRGDMDALPIVEETGLPFASKKTVTLPDGHTVGVMHACGHDMHQTILAATAQTLAAMKDAWKGTVVLVAQPAEEVGLGARLMIEDGLFTRFPKPDYCIALHVSHEQPSGAVGYTSGWVYANVDSVDITVYGVGGHGAYPHAAVDPVVASAHIITALQTIVSRRVNPLDKAVVTVGSVHAGSKHNIIPETATLQITVRSFTEDVRREVLDSIRRIALNTSRAMGCPKDPDIVVLEDEFTPASYNDPKLTETAAALFRDILGEENVAERPPSMGGEDFGRFARAAGVPGFMFQLGVVEPERFAAAQKPGGEPIPTVHSAKFQTDVVPSIRTGARCMVGLAMRLMQGGGEE